MFRDNSGLCPEFFFFDFAPAIRIRSVYRASYSHQFLASFTRVLRADHAATCGSHFFPLFLSGDFAD